MKARRKLSHDELFNKFKRLKVGFGAIDWKPISHESINNNPKSFNEFIMCADKSQPIIEVEFLQGIYLIVYVAEGSNEIIWF